MRHVKIIDTGTIEHNESYEGERIETKIERILQNNEPIKDGAPLIYTERKDGVKAEFDIRTDRFEVALEAMDVVSRTHRSKRDNKGEKIIPIDGGKTGNENDGGAESTQATE